MVIKNCVICGAEFSASRRTTKYCCDVCRKEGSVRNAAERSKNEYEEQKRPDRIAEINALAREAGMSYGKYVGMLYLQEQWRKKR